MLVQAADPAWPFIQQRRQIPTGHGASLRYSAGVDKQSTLALLARSKPELAHRFGVAGLALFGSVARDQAREGSDVDVLVSFDGPATSQRYFGVQFYLEDLLGQPVDLVTEKALRPELRPYVDKDRVDV